MYGHPSARQVFTLQQAFLQKVLKQQAPCAGEMDSGLYLHIFKNKPVM